MSLRLICFYIFGLRLALREQNKLDQNDDVEYPMYLLELFKNAGLDISGYPVAHFNQNNQVRKHIFLICH